MIGTRLAAVQGLPAIATLEGHPDPEGLRRAIRGTATVLRTAATTKSLT